MNESNVIDDNYKRFYRASSLNTNGRIGERTKGKRLTVKMKTNPIKTEENSKEERIKTFTLKHFICSDSGTCMAFGVQKPQINKLFNNFVDFKYANPRIKRIGQRSENGFVTHIEYDLALSDLKLRSYKSYAILKSSIHRDSDNLYYEYLVGRHFINKESYIFPCFLETYGVYTYNSIDDWQTIKNIRKGSYHSINLNKLLTLRDKKRGFTAKACKNPTMISILIENIKDAQSFEDCLNDPNFLLQDLLGVLFQIYMPLSHLSRNFTHYDLHGGNVLIYKPFGQDSNKYITYNYYNSKNKVTTFKSKYLVKIIDYGRSYFNNGGDIHSKSIHSKLCATPECNDIIEDQYSDDDEKENKIIKYANCGDYSGFGFLQSEENNIDNYYINSFRHNISHDLRLIRIINDTITITTRNSDTVKIVNILKSKPIILITNKVENKFMIDLFDVISKTVYNTQYGTPEVIQNTRYKIVNVNDAYYQFEKMISSDNAKNINDKYYNDVSSEKGGDLDIYINKPMKFTPFLIKNINELDNTMRYTIKKKSPNTLKTKYSLPSLAELHFSA